MANRTASNPGNLDSFPVPTRFVDELLPTLKDTELRLALVVMRQTWGYGKQSDWLSHSQLKARTGRAGEAVSAAIDALVRRGVIEVGNDQGIPLSNPAARQRERGRLLYRPGSVLIAAQAGLEILGKVGKSKTTVVMEEYSRFRKTELMVVKDSPAGLRVDGPTEQQRKRIEEQKRRIRERLATLRTKG